jgi:hypothetical protein
MRWFRQHVRRGTWLALFALAINLTLAFGHVHALDSSGRPPALIAALAASHQGQTDHDRGNGHADYICPICMAATAMGTALASVPPALPAVFIASAVDHPVDHSREAPRPPHTAFESRGPPLA